ncbi:MAG: Ig-like domain-containing protein [Muribaculaceae bacterium]|nr:Ig-like domain-containing protein [Muribaculaceae bacterium]
MAKQGSYLGGMRSLIWLCLAILLAACANMGRPEGGARDETPPRFVRSDPQPGATNVTKTRLVVYFDENIQLEDAFSKVVVSPAQKQQPSVSANGKRLTVDIRDTLIADATYTIDFADAIKDLNEGNVLDGFALDFSTGDSIDSLRISGMVLQAENLEPAQGMLVGVYSNLSDTAITTLPFERIARTNQYGHFTIRNLKPVPYRVYAINDLNRDYHWDRSEDVAFYDSLVIPTVEPIFVSDTLYASSGEDSIVERAGVRYLPNDILLSWFNVGYKPHYLSDYKRVDRRRITLAFGAPADSLPRVTIADGAPGIGRDISEWALLKANATLDSLEYWICDTTVLASDSLRLSISYFKTDTTDQLAWTNDTLRFFYREQAKKVNKKEKKDEEPRFTVDSISGDTTFLPPADLEYLTIQAVGSTTQELNKPLRISTNLPLADVNYKGVRLEVLEDTLWKEVKADLVPDSADILLMKRIDYDWKGGTKYRLTVDSLAFTSIYGPWNKDFKHEFTVKNLEDYSNIKFVLPGLDSLQAVVQLLNAADVVVYEGIKLPEEGSVDMRFIAPGTYYARLFIDSNANGKWDTGNPIDSVLTQPEEVYYFAKKLDLKKNWDIEQTWNIDELAIDVQKPYAIKKNRPKLKRGEAPPVDEDEDADDDNYNPFDRTGRNNSGTSGSNRNTSTGSGSNGMRRTNF